MPDWIELREVSSPSTQYFERILKRVKKEKNVSKQFKLHSKDTSIEELINTSLDTDEITRSRYQAYDYLYWLLEVHRHETDEVKGNSYLAEIEQTRLLKKIVSEAFSEYYENARRYYESVIESGNTHHLILNTYYRRIMSDKKLEIKEQRVAQLNSKIGNEKVEIGQNAKPAPLLKWKTERGGVADMAELLYRLDKGGFINLQEFIEKGNASDLCRRICYIFDFKGQNPIGNLANCLSDLKGKLGPGPVELSELKKIGRSRRSKMVDMLPSNASTSEGTVN